MTNVANANIYVERQMSVAASIDLGDGRAFVFSASPAYPDSVNEDAAAVISAGPSRGVLVVADGAGGLPSGHKASNAAVKAVAERIAAAEPSESSLRGAVLDGFDQANREILGLGVGAATTLAVVQIEGRMLRSHHVGDSTVLVVGQRGKVKLLTMSHSPVGYQVEAGLLHPEDALHHKDLNVVSNLVGSDDMRIDVGPTITLAPRDTVLVGSDGLFDNLHLHEIVKIIRSGPLDRVAQRLIDAARTRMTVPQEGLPSKPDDLTFVLYRPR